MFKKKRAKKNTKSKKLTIKSKFNLAKNNFLFFAILTIISFVFYLASWNIFIEEIFYAAAIFFGILALTFFLIVLVFFFMRYVKK